MVSLIGHAVDMPFPQDDKQRNTTQKPPQQQARKNDSKSAKGSDGKGKKTATTGVTAQPILADEDTIPDSLLHPRWPIQRTQPITMGDLYQSPLDLQRPDNMKYQVEYNDTLGRYVVGNKMGNTWLSAPIMMTPAEYMAWSELNDRRAYYRKQNDEIYKAKGKEKFDFTDMHFNLGPAEKIFGPGGIRVRTQGTAELKFGVNLKNIDNPSLPIRNRKTTMMDFDEKINLNVNGKVGDKVNMNLNYNTDATFDYDAQNMKLKYDGKEDEIVKLVEAGNISFPSNSSLIKGASSLFGLRTDLQFGKLKLQLVASQKKSASKSVSSKGGVQLTPFEINVADYEENRHFFLSRYFRDHYDAWMQKLPNLTTGITINRVEIWVTNKTATTANTRNIVALTDLGEESRISNSMWTTGAMPVPANRANTEYDALVSQYAAARDIDQAATTLEGGGLTGGDDFEKLESARLLSSSEYTLNSAMGYVSLKSTLQTDQVLAVAFEYTYGGVTYQVGEFASDLTDTKQALFVKSLKNTSNNPQQGNWDLMMKNVYYLASQVEKEKFRLDVKYQSDTTGVYLNYIPETKVKDTPIIKLLGADRLDNNNNAHSNGYFDYVAGYTVNNGRVFIPKVEPFGSYLFNYLKQRTDSATAEKYAFTQLYTTTKTTAKQIAEKNKFILTGQFKGTAANVISLGAYDVPQGSVLVTAGGVKLTEGTDYTVDYSAGEVTIINQSIIDAGTAVNVSLESNTDYGQMRKTMMGLNWEYDFSKNFQISGTLQHLSEQALTTKVNMGSEPLNNTLVGFNINWKKESQWLTNMLDKIPLLHLTQPSQISFTGEFAKLFAGQASGTQDNASYLDDFETTKNTIDVKTPTSWILSSVPSDAFKSDYSDKTGLTSGFHRSRLAWYTIDPLFTQRGNSLTPGHIKSDLAQLSNHYVREVYVSELFPLRQQSSYSGASSTLSVLNLAYYPDEPGPYNFNPDLNVNGRFASPKGNWGGMMRKLDTNDFEQANIEYIEFWMLDPFIYSRAQGDASQYGGDFYINLGEVSEDVLRDGKKFYESGMPVDGSQSYTMTQWGKVPTQSTVTYAFATTSGSRALQDVGLNGLNDEEEREFYKSVYLDQIQGKVNQAVFDSIYADPAHDDYHYFRGSDWDQLQTPILQRYKYINNPQGNSPDSDNRTESYDTSYKTTPDVEDINQDFTLNEYEKYYQYHVSIRPEDLVVGSNYIVDKREYSQTLRDGSQSTCTWYQFRIPLNQYDSKVGSINDFSSIRFMRMFLTNFSKPIVLRFGTLDLVRGTWRTYNQQLSSASGGTLEASAVSIEESGEKVPVNYVLPPGIQRGQDPSQPQLVEDNEQALSLVVKNLSTGESKAVYKNTTLDIRHYKKLQMFVHANALAQNTTQLQNNQLAVFIRLGSDYKNNYYEYEIPLTLTPEGTYSRYSYDDCLKVWPQDNMLDVSLSIFTNLKKERNKAKAQGLATYTSPYTAYDTNHPNNKLTIVGNPTLGEIKTMMIGVRNNSGDVKSGEVWVNELRLLEQNNKGGWAANGNLNVQLSDLGSVNATGRYVSEGFGGLEDGVTSRSTDTYGSYSITTSLELGKFFPDKAKVTIPLYYSVTKERTSPKYNPLDTDMELKDALDAAGSKQERDSIESIAVTKVTNTNFSISNARFGIATKRHPMPYDPANFSFSYSHSHQHTSGETTVYENEDNWRGALDYSWTPVYKAWEPFKKIKNKSKWFDILRRFGLNWLPQNVAFNTEMTRYYHEQQERDMEASASSSQLPLNFSEQFRWNREFSLRWDLTRNLHANFKSATRAQIEEPYTPVNKDLYPDRYQAWKDSVWTSIKHWGAPLDYNQTFTASYQAPLNLLPAFDWLNADAAYNATYSWNRGTEDEDGTSYGNTVNTNREASINGSFNMVKLYNHVPFLKAVNQKFDKEMSRSQIQKQKQDREKKKQEAKKQQQELQNIRAEAVKAGKDPDEAEKEWRSKANKKAEQQKKNLPKNKRAFEKEIVLLPDTSFNINHGKNTKRLIVSAKTEDGKVFKLKYRKVNANQIKIISRVDTNTKVKISVLPKDPIEDKGWYKVAQVAARLAMMVRNVSFTYRNNYQLTLPGFLPTVGDALGQSSRGALAPGLGFAFGMVDDSYINKAAENDWLLMSDSIASPATSSKTEDLQLRLTLEPVKNLKIDLNASRTMTTRKSVQYMYEGMPTTQSGAFTITTVSLGSAFEGMGNANSGYRSKTFEKFVNSLDGFRNKVEAQYAGARYPEGTALAGQKFDAQQTPVNKYSGDVMIPAFLNAYTGMGGSSLSLFPALSRLLPNWTLRYSGLSKLPWFRDNFKSININHSYKSIFAIGSYNSYSTYQEYMNGIGFISDTSTGNPSPSSMFNISQVSINEAFSPLLGVDMTFNNNMTLKAEYRQTRVLNLSMTSVQINEALSKDWVIGMGYKINNFNFFGGAKRKVKSSSKNKGTAEKDDKKNTASSSSSKRSMGVNHDLNMRLDFSFRRQASIVRDIASMVSSASSGNNALKLSFSADYTLSRMLTMSFYYDRQTNTPLLSSSSYPTTTQDFGLSVKFSLTR